MTCADLITLLRHFDSYGWIVAVIVALPFLAVALTSGYYHYRYGHCIRAWHRLNKGLFE